jgi:hypothetical protein
VTGATTLNSTLGVTGATTLNSTLGVTGVATFNSGVVASSTLGVTGATTLNSTLYVAGAATLNNATTLNSTLGVTGVASFSNAIFASSNVSVQASLSIGPKACDNSYPLKVQTVNANNISIYAAGDVATFSDARYKDDVRRIDRALDKVSAIGGYTFRHADRRGARMAGVLAQELAAVLPEVVSADPDGMMHVSYGNIAALLIEAIKELREERAVDTFRFVAVREGEAFEFACKRGFRRRAFAVISPEDGLGRCCARVVESPIDPTAAVAVGKVELPGAYAIVVY